jgi:hypothetical protein
MNKKRRKQVEAIYDAITEQVESLTFLMEEEQEAYDNLPESFQNGERGEAMQGCIDTLENAIGEIESGMESLQEIFG